MANEKLKQNQSPLLAIYADTAKMQFMKKQNRDICLPAKYSIITFPFYLKPNTKGIQILQ